MKTYEVTNNGRRTRNRLGYQFKPNEPEIVEASARQYVVLNAVKDFEVNEVDGNQTPSASNQNGSPFSEEYIQELQDKNMSEFKTEVERQELSIQEAIEIEKDGKNRVTLIDDLKSLEVDE